MNTIDCNRIDLLPNETFLHILSYLPPRDLGSISSVSRCWHEFAEDPSLWRSLCEKNYGMDFIATIGSPHPKAAMATSIFYNNLYSHLLKPLPFELKHYSNLRLHGHLLIEEGFSKKVLNIFNLSSQEQMTVPDFLSGASFIKWVICNKKLAVIVQDKNNRLIYSESPFRSQVEFKNFSGKVLDIVEGLVFYTLPDKMKLCAFDLKKSETIFDTTLESPLKDFFASKYAYAALLENQSFLIFDEPSDLSKSIKMPSFEGRQFYSSVKMISNHEWLVIVDTNNALFNVFHLTTKKTFLQLRLPISWEKDGGVRCPRTCTGLQLCQNYFFVSEFGGTHTVNLNNLMTDSKTPRWWSDYRLSKEEEEAFPVSEFFVLSENPVDEHKLFVIQDGKLNSLDLSRLEKNGMNVDIMGENNYHIPECYFNGRFLIILEHDKIKYCDFLEPQETTSVHHLISKDSERKIKKIKID